jgi:hypothetical protein
MIFDLPNVSSNADGFATLAALAEDAGAEPSREIKIRFAKLTWFDANMAAPLGAVIAKLTDMLKAVSLVEIAPPQERILRKNGFLTDFGYAPTLDTNRTTIPYKRFKLTDINLFAAYLFSHLPGKGMPNMTSDLALAFQQSLFEIFANAVTHSESGPGVFVCGQFFPIHRRLDISIADAGVGIPRKINEAFAIVLKFQDAYDIMKAKGMVDNHGQFKPSFALGLALAEGFTSKTGKLPGGAGLKIIKRFIELNGGCIQIASGGAFWQFSGGKDQFRDLPAAFPGTVVNLEVNTADTKSYCLGHSSP